MSSIKVFPVDMATAQQIQSELSAITSYNDMGAMMDLKIKDMKEEWAAKGYSRREINTIVRDGMAELARVYGN